MPKHCQEKKVSYLNPMGITFNRKPDTTGHGQTQFLFCFSSFFSYNTLLGEKSIDYNDSVLTGQELPRALIEDSFQPMLNYGA